MTFTIKRTGSDRPMVAEYLCPEHGRFAAEVDRDEHGNPPDDVICGSHTGIFCGRAAPFVISKTGTARVRGVEVVRGPYQKPERPTWTDTTNIGEGQDLDDWIADRDKVWEADREASIKELLDG